MTRKKHIDNFLAPTQSRDNPANLFMFIKSRPGKPNQRKGQNKKFMNFAHFCEFCCFFLGKTSTIHIELLFRNAPGKSSRTDLSLVWFAGATPEFMCFSGLSPAKLSVRIRSGGRSFREGGGQRGRSS